MKSISAFLLAAAVQAAAVWEDMNKMEFAYTVSRHGARTAYLRNPENNIIGLTGNELVAALTPQGMRQCYLKGKYYKARYSHEYNLIDNESYIPGQIYVQSTQTPRAI